MDIREGALISTEGTLCSLEWNEVPHTVFYSIFYQFLIEQVTRRRFPFLRRESHSVLTQLTLAYFSPYAASTVPPVFVKQSTKTMDTLIKKGNGNNDFYFNVALGNIE